MEEATNLHAVESCGNDDLTSPQKQEGSRLKAVPYVEFPKAGPHPFDWHEDADTVVVEHARHRGLYKPRRQYRREAARLSGQFVCHHMPEGCPPCRQGDHGGGTMSKKDKGRLPQFVPLLHLTIKTPAWLAMSHGAKALYIALKSHVPNQRNQAFLSHRDAAKEVGSCRRKIAEWFLELEHYGFIVMTQAHALGVEGKGKAPHWRLTRWAALAGQARTDSSSHPRMISCDGTVPCSSRKQNPGYHGGARVVTTSVPVVATHGHHLNR